jgi:riboflavin transporter FmnP
MLRGGVKFPTGGNAATEPTSPRAIQLSRLDSGADGIVRMGEAKITGYMGFGCCFQLPPRCGGFFTSSSILQFSVEVLKMKENLTVKKMVMMAMLAAISIVLVNFIHFPIFPSAPFLEYDMADVPILIGTFLFGPLNGLILTVIVSIIQGITVSAHSGWVGIIMHIIATGTFVIVAGTIFRMKYNRYGAVLGLACGTLAMTLMMIPLNLVFTVYFLGASRDLVISMLIPIIIPFNFIKAGANSIITYSVYKAVEKIMMLYSTRVDAFNNNV